MLTKNLIKCIKIFLEAAGKPEKDSVYLETGLGKGDSVFQTLNNFEFKKIISIEIDKIKIDEAKIRFKDENDFSKINFIHGDSADKLKEIYDQSINIIFLDAHGRYSDTDFTKFSPQEKEIKFLISKINKNQLIVIDDYIKIRNSHLFKNKFDWRSHVKYKNISQLLNIKSLKKLEIFNDDGSNSYLLLTNNNNFKIKRKLFLINILFKFKTVRFYLFYYKFLIISYLKKNILSSMKI